MPMVPIFHTLTLLCILVPIFDILVYRMWSTCALVYLHGCVLYTHVLVHLCTNNNKLPIYQSINCDMVI